MVQKVGGDMLETGAVADNPTGFTAGNYPRVASDGTLEERTPTQVRADIGAGTGTVTSVAVANATGITWTGSPITTSGTLTPALDATLAAMAGADWAANSLPIGSGADTVAQVTFAANTFPARASTGNLVAKPITDFGLSLVDDANASTARTTLGLVDGTYTPTITNITNVAASTPYLAHYVRIGNQVIVTGLVDIDPTAAAQIEIDISLPVASNFAASTDCSGVTSCGTDPSRAGNVAGNSTTDRARLTFTPTLIDNRTSGYQFMYTVI